MRRIKPFTPWILIFLITLAALPAAVMAQSTPKFANLTVELWPEYDRPEVLVIYRAGLSSDTNLPATVTFRLPARIEDLHAVAVERDGGLFNLPADNIQQERIGDELLLTVTTDSPNIHLEYYDVGMLTKDGNSRQLDFSFVSDYPIETGRFQVQQPLEAQDFSITPAPNDSFTDSNGFSYQAIEPTGLAAGDPVELVATYQRSTDDPSVQFLSPGAPAVLPEQPADVQVVTDEAPGSTNFSLGYILIGVGIALLLATGGYWWWSTRQAASAADPPQKGPRPAPRRQKRSGGSKARPRAAASSSSSENGGYCYQCGTALRPDAKFCHVCGAERRKG